jgi:hypothetical protein
VSRDRRVIALCGCAALGLAWLCGVRFNAAELEQSWTLLDPRLLREDLLRSLFYLHAQPPLLNLIVGVALKLGHAPLVLTALWSACGVAAALCTHALALELGAARAPAVGAGILCAIAPSTLLYAHHPGPELATATALVACALCFSRRKDGAGFALLGAACLLRSILAPPLVLVALAVVGRRAWKPALALLLGLLLLCAKNAAIGGAFSTSSWLGMNLARVTVERLPPPDRPRLPRPFAAEIAVPGSSGVPALDQVRKSGGAINYNNLAYARAARALLPWDLRVLRSHPAVVARAWALAWLLFLRPADDWKFVQQDRGRIELWCDLWDDLLCLRLPLPGSFLGLTDAYLTLLLGLPAALAVAARDRRSLLSLALVLWVALVGNAIEVGENYRFRLLVAPLCLALSAAALRRRA